MYHNIHYVINCTPNLPNMFENKGIKYYRVPIHDKEVCDLSYSKQMYDYILGSFNFIDEALKNNQNENANNPSLKKDLTKKPKLIYWPNNDK